MPDLQDVHTMLALLGVTNEPIASSELVKTVRASILVLGPLVVRFGYAKMSLPGGGCAIGARPVDQHIKGLQEMGTEISIELDYIEVRTTRLKGARIDGIGTDRLAIQGIERLHGASHAGDARPYREAGTFLCAVAAAGVDVTLYGMRANLLNAVFGKLRETGAVLEEQADPLRWRSTPPNTRPSRPTCRRSTERGGSVLVVETIFENRFMHVQELNRLGVDIVGTAMPRWSPAWSGCRGDGHRPARLGQPRDRGPVRRRRDRHRPYVPSRSRL